MKKILAISILIFCCLNIYAQKIALNSNGYNSTFTKIDTLFFNEYAGQKTKLQLSASDSSLNNSILQFDSSFGLITKSDSETQKADSTLSNSVR